MKKKERRDTVMQLLFLAGILVGTIAALLFSKEFTSRVEGVQGLFTAELDPVKLKDQGYFFYVLSERGWQLLLLFFFGLTSLAYYAFGAVLFGSGFFAAVMVTSLTTLHGMMGLVHFLFTILPQYLFYGAFLLLLMEAARREMPLEKKNFAIFCMQLCIVMLLGVMAEAYVNPWLVRLIAQ